MPAGAGNSLKPAAASSVSSKRSRRAPASTFNVPAHRPVRRITRSAAGFGCWWRSGEPRPLAPGRALPRPPPVPSVPYPRLRLAGLPAATGSSYQRIDAL